MDFGLQVAAISTNSPSSNSLSDVAKEPWVPHFDPEKRQVLVVEDDEFLRDDIGMVLEDAGYAISLAGNGREALGRISTDGLPSLIVLDLRMPIMDGWEFRTVQQKDKALSRIPIVAMSADQTPKAVAISADAFLCKPFDSKTLLGTIERVLLEDERQPIRRGREMEPLTVLGQIAAKLGHDINNPLTVVLLNLGHLLKELRPSIGALKAPVGLALTVEDLQELKARLLNIIEMLEECQIGGERIREAVGNLHQLVYQKERRLTLDMDRPVKRPVPQNQIEPV